MEERPCPVWITGAGGLIGHHLSLQAPSALPGHRIVPITRRELDLADFNALRLRFAADQPGIVIHCAALSRSPACQENPSLARTLNVEVTRTLAELCAGWRLVFFSTDLVFDGRRGHYREEDSPNPLMVYGETKVEAESLVLKDPAHLVIRTSINAGTSPTGNRGFDEEMCNAWRAGRTVRLFGDEYRTPIAAEDTARAVLGLIRAGATGIVHVSGSERLNRFAIGELLAAKHRGLSPKIERTSLREYPGAPRPEDVSLDCSRAGALLGWTLPRFSDWIAAQPEG